MMMSPWIATAAVLEPYCCVMSAGAEQGRDDGLGDLVPLEYLANPDYGELSSVLLLAPPRTRLSLSHPWLCGVGRCVFLSLGVITFFFLS
jgi:hypothetical protein